MLSKLTLSVDPAVVSRAKRYASRRGTSVSALVEAYLDSVSDPPVPARTPILGSLRGTLKKASIRGYRQHLAEKYR